MTKLTTESLEKFVNDIKTDGMCDITDYQVALALRQLLAYEQAAKNPVGYRNKFTGQFFTLQQQPDAATDAVVYEPVFLAAPVLPKQPERLPVISERELFKVWNNDIDCPIAGLEPSNAAWKGWIFRSALEKPVMLTELLRAINLLLDSDGSRGCFDALEQHRAKTELERLLATVQQNEPQNIPENIPAQPVIPEQIEPAAWRCDKEGTKGVVITVHKQVADSWILKGWKVTPLIEANQSQLVSEPYKLPDNLDFDCEFENGDYDIDEEPWLRGRVDGFNEALQIIKRSLNAKQNPTVQESE
ncbi:MAG: hypothetical protein [Caudoviricetes sp.]|nr:MAG: hypothetical protein [Caudoviricetes sp.]